MKRRCNAREFAVGIDGCRAGWIAAFLAGGRTSFEILATIESAWPRLRGASRILIDVPIGMADTKRQCDLEAKRLLGRHNSRVFLTPPRIAAFAASYPEANRLCREIAGFGLSKQTWNILPKVREIDQFLESTPEARGHLRECHPEICFAKLAGVPIADNKKTERGAALRLESLADLLPGVREDLDEASRRIYFKQATRDDMMDALVAAVVAASPESALRTLPSHPTQDARGLAMEMVYRVP